FLTGVSVAFVPIFLAIFWRRKISRWSVIGVLTAFIGLFLLTVPAGPASWGDFASVNKGDWLTIICAVAFAFHIISIGRAAEQYPFQSLSVVQIATAAALMLATAPMLETLHVIWSARVIAAILVTGLLGLAAAFTIQAWAQQFISPTNAGLIFALEPVFAWIT